MRTRSEKHGTTISEIEVTNISSHGLWVFVNEKEYFLSYLSFPWFRQAKIDDILNVQISKESHLYWPALDIDLTLDIIEYPDKYPLVAK